MSAYTIPSSSPSGSVISAPEGSNTPLKVHSFLDSIARDLSSWGNFVNNFLCNNRGRNECEHFSLKRMRRGTNFDAFNHVPTLGSYRLGNITCNVNVFSLRQKTETGKWVCIFTANEPTKFPDICVINFDRTTVSGPPR